MALELKGSPVRDEIINKISREIEKDGIAVNLLIIRMGEKANDLAYEKSIIREAEKACIKVMVKHINPAIGLTETKNMIEGLNEDPNIHGILVLRPMDNKEIEDLIVKTLSLHKDVDGITPLSMAGLYQGSKEVFPPCTAQACMEILKHYRIDIKGKKAVVVGRSLVIGKPVSMLLLASNASVTICHSKSEDLEGVVRGGDLVITAIGRAGALTKNYFCPNQVVLDVGINFDEDGKLTGDIAFKEVANIVKAITPVPGGVGAVTTALLLEHTLIAARIAAGNINI